MWLNVDRFMNKLKNVEFSKRAHCNILAFLVVRTCQSTLFEWFRHLDIHNSKQNSLSTLGYGIDHENKVSKLYNKNQSLS